MDGFSHVYTIANWETFASPMGRHVLILHQLLPVIWAKLGASTTTIMQMYVLNDTLLHLAVFLILLIVLKNQWAALFVVSVHVFGMYFNHFMMVGELHPGSIFAILTLSLVFRWEELSGVKKLLLIPAMFFTVSSHPLALVSFLTTFWIWRLSTNRDKGLGYFPSFGITSVMLGLKLLMLDDYDVNTVEDSIRPFSEALGAFLDPGYLLNFSLFFLFSSPVISLLLVFGSLYMILNNEKLTAGFLIAFVLSWSFFVQKYLDFTYFSLDFIQSMMHDRYLFPIRFVTLGVALLVIVPKQLSLQNRVNLPKYVMVSWLLGVPFLVFSSKKADHTVAEFRSVIAQARSQGIVKGFYPVEKYCANSYIHQGSYFATLVLSNLDHLPPVQVVHANANTMAKLPLLGLHETLLMEAIVLDTEHLEHLRISHPTGKYQPLDYTCK